MTRMRTIRYALLLVPVLVRAADDTAFRLGRELLAETSYELAAVEFRRFAMQTTEDEQQAAAYLYSGYAYLRAGEPGTANEMFDRAEDADASSLYKSERILLGAEAARQTGNTDAAMYYYDALTEDDETAMRIFARRRAAALQLASGNLGAARRALERSPAEETAALHALDTYAAGTDKRPLLGGLLGLVPGAGYWYSGEVANGFRSLILNGLFIFGMAQSAHDDQWGAFAVMAFFEVTWYSGSIYGGIDAAQRYNRRRLDVARQGIESELNYRPDPQIVVPAFQLNIRF